MKVLYFLRSISGNSLSILCVCILSIFMESASVAHVVIIRAMSNSTKGDDKEQYLKFFKEAVKNQQMF
ncbi:MAG: hypothetical protein KFW21_01185 [Spirochaetota bacterium]|nr:hypothetical protein [Spirochaetota bacterium]